MNATRYAQMQASIQNKSLLGKSGASTQSGKPGANLNLMAKLEMFSEAMCKIEDDTRQLVQDTNVRLL